jgi:hypothetical protein
MACGCGRRARLAAVGEEIVGYRVHWPDGTATPEVGSPSSELLTRLAAQVLVRNRNGGSAKAVKRKIA